MIGKLQVTSYHLWLLYIIKHFCPLNAKSCETELCAKRKSYQQIGYVYEQT